MHKDYENIVKEYSALFKQFPQLKIPEPNPALYYFDKDEAEGAVNFFQGYITHVEGPYAGEKLKLELWQDYIVRTIYGWKRYSDNTRKYRTVFIFIPRKSGKSFLGAGFCLKGLAADNELGGRVVTAAADREQASQIFDTAKLIVENDPILLEELEPFRRVITMRSTGSNYRVLSADVKTKHGKNLSTVVVDELHAQPNRDLVDVLFTSVGSRLQPLKIMLTTAGFDRKTICWEFYDYAKKVMAGIVEDEEFLPIIFEPDEKDDWKKEETWIKANPNLGVSVTWDYFRSEFKQALERPSYENTFKRLHLNIWTEQETRWVPIEKWDECAGEINEKKLEGLTCFGGVDLASKVDITALLLIFPINDTIKILPRFWVPRENIPLRKKRDRVDYDVWVRQGFITALPGNVMNYDPVRAEINNLYKRFNIKGIGFDPWNAQDLMTKLESDNLEIVQIPQTFKYLTDATKELEALILSHKIEHGGNPVLRWMFSNIAVFEDGNGNIKLNKKESKEKIDGMVALVNALSRWLAAKEAKVSAYTTPQRDGLRTLG